MAVLGKNEFRNNIDHYFMCILKTIFMNIVYKISLPIIYIKCQVAKMSGSEHVQVAKVLIANRSGSEQV